MSSPNGASTYGSNFSVNQMTVDHSSGDYVLYVESSLSTHSMQIGAGGVSVSNGSTINFFVGDNSSFGRLSNIGPAIGAGGTVRYTLGQNYNSSYHPGVLTLDNATGIANTARVEMHLVSNSCCSTFITKGTPQTVNALVSNANCDTLLLGSVLTINDPNPETHVINGTIGDNITPGGITMNSHSDYHLILRGGGGGLGGGNTYSGPTTVESGYLDFDLDYVSSPYSALMIANSPNAVVDFFGTTQTIGSLAGGEFSSVLFGIDGSLTTGFDQTSTTYGGLLVGDVTTKLSKIGTGTFTLTGNNEAFAGDTTVSNGTLVIAKNAILGGNITLLSGTIQGLGTLGSGSGSTITTSGGVLHFGNSPGVLYFNGNHINNGATNSIDIVGQGNIPGTNNGVLNVTGTETITNAPLVSVTSLDGSYYIGGLYTIINSNGGLTGAFNPDVVTSNLSLVPHLLYDNNHAYLDFQTPFLALAENSNQENIAETLVALAGGSPTADELSLLTNITASSIEETKCALQNLSGSQYVAIQAATELSTHQFVRRLYEPIRSIITSNPCCLTHCEPEAWLEVSGNHAFIHGNDESNRVKISGIDVSGGVQMQICDSLTIGIAATYENDQYHFSSSCLSGHSKNNTALGSIYGAYHADKYYILGDCILGGSWNKFHRSFAIGLNNYEEKSKPETKQGLLYLELGLDLPYCGILFQPFIGVEGGYFEFKEINEKGSSPIALHFSKKSYGTLNTSLGAHMTTETMACGLTVGLDLAWRYRATEARDHLHVAFQDIDSSFDVYGVYLDRNSLDGTLNVTQKINHVWSVFVSGTAEYWSNSSAYNVTGGISARW